MALDIGIGKFSCEKSFEEDGSEDLDMSTENEALDADITLMLRNVEAFDNLQAIAACDVSNEALLAIVPFLAQDSEAYEFFKLDKPNAEFIRSQLSLATEGIVSESLRLSIPFIGKYLDSQKRLLRVLSNDKHKLSKLNDLDDMKFNRIKSNKLDVKEHFFDKLKALKRLSVGISKNSVDLENFNISDLNMTLALMGLEIESREATNILMKGVTGDARLIGAGVIYYNYYISIKDKARAESIEAFRAAYAGIEMSQERIDAIRKGMGSASEVRAAREASKEIEGIILAMAKKMVSFKVLGVAVLGGQLISTLGATTAQVLCKLLSVPIAMKGWKKSDVALAVDGVSDLLAEKQNLELYIRNIEHQFKEKYKLLDPKRHIYTARFNLLNRLVGIYTKSVVQLAHGVHDVFEKF